MLNCLPKAPSGYAIQLNSVLGSGISQPSLSTIMPVFLDGIINITSQCIKFPYSMGEQAYIKRQFTVNCSDYFWENGH